MKKIKKKYLLISIIKNLPEFLKEIQEKMNLNHLKDENRKLKAKNVILQQSSKEGSDFLIESEFRKDNNLKN